MGQKVWEMGGLCGDRACGFEERHINSSMPSWIANHLKKTNMPFIVYMTNKSDKGASVKEG